jgi:hypothetical protein
MAILRTTVVNLANLTAGLSRDELRAAPAAGEWSVAENLAHLRASQDVLGGHIRRMLAEDRPRWRRMSPREWQRRTDYGEWDFEPAFAVFSQQRVELLALVEPLPPAAWERVALVTDDKNRESEKTTRFYGDWLASHEREHLTQIAETAAAVRGL